MAESVARAAGPAPMMQTSHRYDDDNVEKNML